MVHLLNDLDKYTEFHKNLTDIKLAVVICTEYMNDSREIINNTMKEVNKTINTLNIELKNYEDSIKYDLQEGA